MIIPTYNIFISHVKIDEDNVSFFKGIMLEYFGKLWKGLKGVNRKYTYVMC